MPAKYKFFFNFLQCYLCLEFGHTKTYVNYVKCGLSHLAVNCNNDNDSEQLTKSSRKL